MVRISTENKISYRHREAWSAWPGQGPVLCEFGLAGGQRHGFEADRGPAGSRVAWPEKWMDVSRPGTAPALVARTATRATAQSGCEFT